MKKDMEDIWKEIRLFKSLKPTEQKAELENLAERLKGIQNQISSNSKQAERAEYELKTAEAKSEAVKKKYSEARERRQNAVALGEDDAKFKISISELMVEQDLIEDRCIGLKRRIENLKTEGNLLEQERIETEKTILRFRLIPLVDKWNGLGEELADVLKQIIVLANQLGEPFYEFRTGATTIFYSGWEGIDAIAKLYLIDEVNDPQNKWPSGKFRGIFNLNHFYEELRQKREKTAEAPQQPVEKVVVA